MIELRPIVASDLDTFFLMQQNPEARHMAAFVPENPEDRADFGQSTVDIHHSCNCGCDEGSEQCCCSAPATGTYLQSCAAIAGGLTSPLLIEGVLTHDVRVCKAILLPADREFGEQLPCKCPQVSTTIDRPPQPVLS